MTDDREGIRARYRPTQFEVLFVAESPPANLGTFFYKRTGHIYPRTCEAFSLAGDPWSPPPSGDFLEHFQRIGCFLVDLCAVGVNVKACPRPTLDEAERRLARTIREAKPRSIVVLLKRIEPYVRSACAMEGAMERIVGTLPFPAHGHQRQYVIGLRDILQSPRRRAQARPL